MWLVKLIIYLHCTNVIYWL